MYQFFADIVTFVPVGALIVMSGWHRRFGSDRVGLVLAGLTITGAIEFMQLLVISRFTDVTDVLLGTLGVLIGGSYTARLVAAPDARPASRTGPQSWGAAWPWALGIFGYSAFLAGGFLFPFDVTDDRQLILSRVEGFFRVPFLSLYEGTEANALEAASGAPAPLRAARRDVGGRGEPQPGRRSPAVDPARSVWSIPPALAVCD